MVTGKILPDASNRRGAFRLLFFALMAVGAGNTMLITAVLPLLVRRLDLPAWTAGAIFSLSAFLWVIFSPFWGRKSNTWGRRPVAALGLAGFAVSMVLFGFVGMISLAGVITFWPLIFLLLLSGRSLFGVFGSGTNPAAQAYVADRTDSSNRTEEIATLTSGFTFGTAIGPSLAGVLIDQVHLLAPVFVIAAIAVSIGVGIWFFLPEHRAPEMKKVVTSEGKGLWRDKSVYPFLVYGVGLSLVSGVILQTFPYFMLDRLHDVGYLPDPSPQNENPGAQELGIVMTLGALATLTAQLALIPRLKLSPKALMVSGAAFLVVSAALTISLPTLAVFGVAQILYGIGQGFSRPGFTSGASLAVGTTLQGNVAGLVTATNAMGFVVSPLFGLWAYENVHPFAPFVFAAGVLVFMGVFAFFQATNTYQEDPPLLATDEEPH
ncbi:MAG: drug:proton antiporter [Ponticaulis sp.]|nr:drug:proton antiporter [Ponticaulis sp.]|tara:strand:- start:2601 stop:3905 length:1305 start_codon:yes stop_codon:yes gene_type:complete